MAMDLLVIDDSKEIQDVFKCIFYEEGYSVVCADNGEAALPLLRHERFDYIFCDIHMPLMNGMDVFEYIIQNKPELKKNLIFMSGDWSQKTEDFIERSQCYFLKKPFGLEELLEVVER